jgi:hypothetical protein
VAISAVLIAATVAAFFVAVVVALIPIGIVYLILRVTISQHVALRFENECFV